jgi:hypothetical protein
MFTSYFDTCNSLEEAGKLYRSLAKQHHPDHGGDLRTMQEINAQYAEFCATFTNRSERQRQAEAHAAGRKTNADFNDLDAVTEELRVRILWALNNLPQDVTVELCGLWVWLTGNTKPVKDTIYNSGYGFKFAGKKQAWFYAGVKSFGRGQYSMDDIRSLHGSKQFARTNGKRNEEAEREAIPAAV